MKSFKEWVEARLKYGDMSKFADPTSGSQIQSIDDDDELWNKDYQTPSLPNRDRGAIRPMDLRMDRPEFGEINQHKLMQMFDRAKAGDEVIKSKIKNFLIDHPNPKMILQKLRQWNYMIPNWANDLVNSNMYNKLNDPDL